MEYKRSSDEESILSPILKLSFGLVVLPLVLCVQEGKLRGVGKGTAGPQPPLAEVLRPLVEEQKSINQKIAKLNHSIEVCRLFGVVDTKLFILDLAF